MSHLTPSIRESVRIKRSLLHFMISISVLLPLAGPASGTTNKCVRQDGRIEFTDQPCAPVPRAVKPTGPGNRRTEIGIASVSAISTLAGSPGDDGGTDGIGRSARFANPTGLTSDGANLYITEAGNHTIRKLDLSTGRVTTLAGQAGKPGYMDGVGSAARFNSPHGIATDGKYLYVADSSNKLIRKISIATGEVSTLAGHPSGGTTDGIGTDAGFLLPEDVTILGNNLYVTDQFANTVRKIDIATAQVTTFAGLYVANERLGVIPGFTDGKGQNARFNFPMGITNDGKDLYVADENNNKIRKIEVSTAEVTTLAGPDEATCEASGWRGRCPGGIVDGTGSSVRLSYPQYLATDGIYLYVTASNNTIRRINLFSGEVTTLISSEAASTTGTAIARQLRKAWGVLVSGDGGLFVTDRVAHSIHELK